uniref:CC domain-containing protein n=1 Tax=Syphacia muris TaxID=451379 RepID=A0A0N5AWA1_9BILA
MSLAMLKLTSIALLLAVFASSLLILSDARSVAETDSIGPCINGKCPEKFFCDTDHKCYPDKWKPLGKVIGRCVNQLCPAKHTCQMDYCVQTARVSANARNAIFTANPAAAASIGPCVNELCPEGYVCRNDGCYAA